MNTEKMLGRKCPVGPGGRDCACCGTPAGRGRVVARRTVKRRERREWKKETR